LSGDSRAAGGSALEKRSTIELVPGFRGAASHLSPLSTPITPWVAKIIRKKHAMRFGDDDAQCATLLTQS
jgi:hypothetical protein